MRVLVFNEAPANLVGGIMTETRQLVAGLQERGHEVALAGDAPLDHLEVRHFEVAVPRSQHSTEQFRRAVEVFDPDIVHVMFAFSGGILGYGKLLEGRPWVLTCHSTPPREWVAESHHTPDWLHYLVRLWKVRRPTVGGLLVYGLRKPPHVVVHSRTIRSDLRQRLYPRRRISIVPFGYRPAAPGHRWPTRPKPGDSPRILTLAGITHTKGHHDVVAALPAVLERHPGMVYTIMGRVRDPSYVEFLKHRIARLGLERQVRFALAATDDQVEEAFRDADLFVQPSHEEGFCLSFFEAASRVERLVGTRTGAIAEISADDAGAEVVPVHRPEALAAAMLKVLAVDLAPDHMQERDARLAERFAWSRYFDAHEAVYRSVIERERRGSQG